jgi:hypothetical protein
MLVRETMVEVLRLDHLFLPLVDMVPIEITNILVDLAVLDLAET